MSFIIYDLIFLVLFIIVLSLFLYRGKKNIKKEGLLLLYKTSWGIKLINFFGNKYKKTLKFLSYISIAIGYFLMATMIYLFGKIVYIYMFQQDIVRAIKIPPIIPLVPYLPQAFKLDFLPPFYFTYWILIIAIIAITHEFSHGIFAALNNVKIKKTGFGFFPFFLPIFLAAFVELDEKEMAKKSKFSQLAVLSAGTFANVLTGILFAIILVLFFSLAFTPTGVVFDDYVYVSIAISGISSLNGIALENASYEEFVNLINDTGPNEIEVEDKKYVGVGFFTNTKEYVKLYEDFPAINARLEKVIFKINGVDIKNRGEFLEEFSKYSPGDVITLNVLGSDGENYDKDILLEEHPEQQGRAWLGIGFFNRQRPGVLGKITTWLTSFKDPHVYYESKISQMGDFIYDFLWWTVLISISVALINMLPMGIFDGGRFFYLTIWGLTKSEKKARRAFAFTTQFILFLILFLIVLWAISVF